MAQWPNSDLAKSYLSTRPYRRSDWPCPTKPENFRDIVFSWDLSYKPFMYRRVIAGIIVGLWLAVNLLGCLTADAYDLRLAASSTVISTSFDIPDDLKHPSLFPLAGHISHFHPACVHSSVANRFLEIPSIVGPAFKPHVLNCVFLV
jgi:hypothetical protein